ncbi:putative flavoprotein [Ophiobolus disseminans]|uniref:Putative flavoprotein n=1 Tax=Ophiobolus disseminans TaxID=1469910 RepID=A0A6A6ZUC1_9PLEO|nr:putative flavoprotein [Ophiobolus disseminans]
MGSMPKTAPAYDVLIIGAGLSGVCSLYHIRKQFPGWKVKVIDNAPDVGGTWYWNRYPGCRLDSETLAYCFSFDKELLQEWQWKNTFAPRDETYNYIKRVVEKHDLRKDMQFDTQIKSAYWDNVGHYWTFVNAVGETYTTRFFMSCVGFLSAPTLPAIPGIHDFQGLTFHTSRWPADIDINRDFANKKIGVIGTGATGIQIITALSKESSIQSLSVFQRTANWSAPLRNSEISASQMLEHQTGFDKLFQRCAETTSGFIYAADPRKTFEVTDEERIALYERLYEEPGFGKWLGVFSDTYTNRQANDAYSAFIAAKIRQRVNDPVIAETLIPKDHGFGLRRVPLESGYFEAYNHSNVRLVDLKKTPISHISADGIVTADGETHELDILICATGFDAITGAFNAIEWHGKHDRPLIGTIETAEGERAIWPDHRPNTFLGLTVPAMPNMFMTLGPHQPFGNATRSIEHAVQFICDIMSYCDDHGYTYVEPTEEAAEAWTEHVVECSKGALTNEVDSWMTGVNKNVKGKTKRSVARYSGSVIEYKRRCAECKVAGYAGLIFK